MKVWITLTCTYLRQSDVPLAESGKNTSCVMKEGDDESQIQRQEHLECCVTMVFPTNHYEVFVLFLDYSLAIISAYHYEQ